MSFLEVRDLELSIDGEQILNGLNIGFDEDGAQAVVGPNGAGKSSLAFSITGLK